MGAAITNRFIIHAFLILALLTGAVSPACKFIRGEAKSVIEICTLYGLKKIEWPAPAPQKDKPHKPAGDCAFCFAIAKIKFLNASDIHLVSRTTLYPTLLVSLRDFDVRNYEILPLPARGPPIHS